MVSWRRCAACAASFRRPSVAIPKAVKSLVTPSALSSKETTRESSCPDAASVASAASATIFGASSWLRHSSTWSRTAPENACSMAFTRASRENCTCSRASGVTPSWMTRAIPSHSSRTLAAKFSAFSYMSFNCSVMF